jgi:hypothetical protein
MARPVPTTCRRASLGYADGISGPTARLLGVHGKGLRRWPRYLAVGVASGRWHKRSFL